MKVNIIKGMVFYILSRYVVSESPEVNPRLRRRRCLAVSTLPVDMFIREAISLVDSINLTYAATFKSLGVKVS